MKVIYQVTAHFDDETGRWTAMSDDIPGLVCEAADIHELKNTIRELAPILLEMNDIHVNGPLPINISANMSLMAAE